MGPRLLSRVIASLHNYLRRPGLGPLLIKAAIGSLGLRILGMGFGFLVGVQLARGLGVDGYGVYGLAMSIVALLTVAIEAGVPQVLIREVAAGYARGDFAIADHALQWALKVIAGTTVVVAVCLYLVAFYDVLQVGKTLSITLVWCAVLLPVVAIGNANSAILRGTGHLVDGQVAEILIRPILMAGMLYIVASTSQSNLAPSSAMALNVLAALVASAYAISRVKGIPKSRNLAGQAVPQDGWLRSAMPMALSEGMRVLAGHVGILILGFLASTSEIGFYRVALGIYTVTILPSALLNVVIAPQVSALKENGQVTGLARLNSWTASLLLVSAAVFLIPFLFFGTDIISLIFGVDYVGANNILIVLLFGELVSAFFGLPTVVLNMVNEEKAVVRYSWSAITINVLASVIGAQYFGAIGVAIALVLGQIFLRVSTSAYAWKVCGMHTSVLAWGVHHDSTTDSANLFSRRGPTDPKKND